MFYARQAHITVISKERKCPQQTEGSKKARIVSVNLGIP